MTTKIDTVKVKECFKEDEIGEHYRSVGIAFDAGEGESSHEFFFSYPIVLLSVLIPTAGLNNGDKANFSVGPLTLGQITADVVAGEDVIAVEESVPGNCGVGDFLSLDDGSNSEEHICIEKNLEALTVKLAQGVENGYLVSGPTYVKLTKKMGIDIELCSGVKYDFGKSKIGGSFIPANTVVRVAYTNTGTGSVRVRPVLEIMY